MKAVALAAYADVTVTTARGCRGDQSLIKHLVGRIKALIRLWLALVASCTDDREPLYGVEGSLPDPLRFADGRTVTSRSQWPERRAEILELFRQHVYGRAPGPPDQLTFTLLEEDPAALAGTANLRRVAITSQQGGRQHSFELIRFAPNTGTPSGVLLLLNNRDANNTDPTRAMQSEFWPVEAAIARGYAIAAIQNDELAVDDAPPFAAGVIHLFEGDAAGARPPDAWKAIGAWSWGASRAMDYLATDPLIDPTRVAVIGHSRGGKAALWAGAQDERFSLTISNGSGCAGAALSRRPSGVRETVKVINALFPDWFADNFRTYDDNEDALPVDQHMLIGLVAPRAVAVGSGSNDSWADPEGEYLGLAYASSVYALWDAARIDPTTMPSADGSLYVAPRGYHLRTGNHDLTAWDWQRYMDVADQAWSGSRSTTVPASRAAQ
jgi:hypothetical protein